MNLQDCSVFKKKKFFDKCWDDKMTKTCWKSTFQLFISFLIFFSPQLLWKPWAKKKLVNIYSPAAELSWMPKDISCFLMSSSSATELCLFLPRKIVGVAGGTKNTRKLFVFLWHKGKKEVFGPLAHNNFSLSIRDKDTSNILDFFRD